MSSSPDPVTAVADLVRTVLEPISLELAERYTTKFVENERAISAEMRKYPEHDSAKIEALKQDNVDILVKVKMEYERNRAQKKQ